MPDIIQTLRDTYASNPAAALNMLPEIIRQYDEGLIILVNEEIALAMGAGARAITQNKQGKHGMTYVYDVFGSNKKISYCFAAQILRAEAEQKLKEREANA